MINIDEYKINPCRIAAIPYWKVRTYTVPENIIVVHDEEYNHKNESEYEDTQYFRLKHDLKEIESMTLDNMFEYRLVDTNDINALMEVVNIINKCYVHIQVDLNQVTGWVKSEVFNENLWVLIVDKNNEKPAALGIAELDKDVREGMLEWIQVLPEYQNRKLGQALVTKLLLNLIGDADFATVSGEVENKTKPEKLYRKCGFKGNDVWHILAKKYK